jgi:hypothetical protein
MPRKTNTPPIDRVQAVADVYVNTILDYCKSNKLSVKRTVGALLNRPQAVRVGKMASFKISETPVSELLDTEEIYYATNKAYSQFKRQQEIDIDSVKDDELLKALKG